VIDVAIVGMGKMGILHASILGALPDVRVAAVCEKKGIVRRFAKSALPRVRVVEDLSGLEDIALDAVYVATLPGAHHPVVREIYARGIADNLFVEKSLASSHVEAADMCRWASERGGVTMVGFQKRFGVTFRKAKELLDDGAIGAVTSFEAYAYSSDFADAPADAKHSVSRGGVLRDSGCHAIDLALWYFGDVHVASVNGHARRDMHGPLGEVPPDFTCATVSTPTGALGSINVSAQVPGYRLPEIGMTIVGSNAELRVNEDRLELLLGQDEPRRWHRHDLRDGEVPFLLGDPEYTRENQAFVAAVAAGRQLAADFDAGRRVEHLIDQIVGGQS
jgi:predicted dehydrogenase